MFFSISNCREHNFTNHYNVGPVWINVDAGWSAVDSGQYLTVYKGYVDHKQLLDCLESIIHSIEPVWAGNYCVLMIDKATNTVSIKTDRYRGFPIYVNHGNSVTNLCKQPYTVWTDSLLTVNPDITIQESKFDAIGSVDDSVLEYDYVLSEIHKILTIKTQQFLSNNTLPIKVHLSGGVDSLLVYSYIQAHTSDYELVKCAHVDYDQFWLLNETNIQQHWGYTQIHHWISPCVLTSGAPGDEFMLRSPSTADLYLKSRGLSIVDLMRQSQWADCLHRDYFSDKKHQEIFANQVVDSNKSLQQLNRDLCNINLNDWQHWHIGNTLTWTPLRDLDIFKLMLQLPVDRAVAQILNSEFSKALIELNNPSLVATISDQKNSKNPMKNLVRLLIG
jgi:hypothetical protein